VKTILGSRLSAHLMCAAILFLFAALPSRAHAQPQYHSPGDTSPFEVSVGYNAIRANAPVGGCGCFYMQGGRAEVGFPVFRWVSGVAEVGGGYADHINSFGDGVARMTYLFGPRVTHKARHRTTVFAQTLFGGAHGFDGYFPTATSSSSSANSFAISAGGGVDLNLSNHLGIRVLQADYLYTKLPNAAGDRQNNLRLGTGIVIRIH
jgi:hypothetical protein